MLLVLTSILVNLMSNFTKLNHTGIKIADGYNFTGNGGNITAIGFKKSKDLFSANPEQVYQIWAMYPVTNPKFGNQIVAICSPDGDPDRIFRFGLPRSFTDEIDPDDDGLISDCNAGNARFKIYQYHSKRFDKDVLTVQFI